MNIITVDRRKLDLMDQAAVSKFFKSNKFDLVLIASARIGGVQDIIDHPVDFLTDNIIIQANIIRFAHETGVQNLMMIGSSRLYPITAPQPIKENSLLTGPLDDNIAPYAIAKITGIKMCEAYNKQFGRNYFVVMQPNTYGVGDKYEGDKSHVIPGLVQRIHQAMISKSTEVTIWGSGKPRREFMYIEDFTDACLLLLNTDKPEFITNIGSETDISIAKLAETLAKVIGYNGTIIYDNSKPDGVHSKLMDNSRITKLGFVPKVGLAEGLKYAYLEYLRDQTHNACSK